MIAVFILCHRKRKRRRLEHPMIPSHAHFHTCESIGERFATSSSMDSVSIFAGESVKMYWLQLVDVLGLWIPPYLSIGRIMALK